MVRTFSFQCRALNSLPPTQQHQKLLSAKWKELDDEEKKVGLNILGLHIFDEPLVSLTGPSPATLSPL